MQVQEREQERRKGHLECVQLTSESHRECKCKKKEKEQKIENLECKCILQFKGHLTCQ